ncbi:MAG TPA: PBP1A family penicillin-binding protein [Bacilli bacterium]
MSKLVFMKNLSTKISSDLSNLWRRPGTKRKLLVNLLVGIVVCLALLALMVSLWISTLNISKLNNPMSSPTFIMDKNGKKVSQLSSTKSEPVPIAKIPKQLQHAIVAVEDQRFFEHAGVDLRSIGRALVTNAKSGSSQGASTITQQLAKNLFLSSEQTLSRKLKEAAYALKIDLRHNKEEILELYLNNIYMGEGQWGVQAASKVYFGKNVEELNLEESAMLAALPKAPSHYSPLRHMEAALERRNLVLSLMMDQKYITVEEFKQAEAKPIALKKDEGEQLKGQYASYVDHVLEEAEDLYGYTEDELLSSGLLIYTELDPIVQEAAEKVYSNPEFFPVSKDDQLIQSGTVILDHKNGGIRALIGYRGKGVFRGFNHATQLKRQPGSSFKPLIVYGPALEKGYTPNSKLYDGDLDINGYRPVDWDHQTRGEVTMSEAISQSWNIPAVWLLNEIGIDTGMNFARKAGIPLTKEDRTLGIALGGLSTGVSPLQMAQGFQTFSNLGVMFKAHAIIKITTRDGKVLNQAKPVPVQVTSPKNAYTMTLLLEKVVTVGVGTNAKLDRPTAGKTGTTELPDTKEFANIDSKGVKDAWFVGYTPELTAAVWVGYDVTDSNHYLTTSGGKVPSVIFREILTLALQNVPPTPFIIPKGMKEEKKKERKEDKGRKEDRDDNNNEDEGGGGDRKGRGKGKSDN